MSEATGWFLAWAAPEVQAALEEYKKAVEEFCSGGGPLSHSTGQDLAAQNGE